jgi:hypothetical protein
MHEMNRFPPGDQRCAGSRTYAIGTPLLICQSQRGEVEMEITKAAALGTGGVPILHASR